MTQVWFGRAVLQLSYLRPNNGLECTTPEAASEMICSAPGTFKNLRVKCETAPGLGAFRTLTFRVNGVDTALQCFFNAADTDIRDTTHSVAVAAGDRIVIHVDGGGFPSHAVARYTLEFVPDSDNDSIYGGCSINTVDPTLVFANGLLVSNGLWSALTDSDNLISVDGALTRVDYKLDAAPGVGNSLTFTVYKNGNPTSATVTISGLNTTGRWTGALALAVGDRVQHRVAENANIGNFYISWGAAFRASSPGYAIVTSHRLHVPSDTDVNYELPHGGDGPASYSLTEAPAEYLGPITARALRGLIVQVGTAPGGGKSYSIATRRNAATVSSSPVAIVAGANTTASDAVHALTIAEDDVWAWQSTPAGTPASANGIVWAWQMVATDFTPETIFEGAKVNVDVGLTLIHLYTRDNAQRTFSDKPLPDPADYENGWKAPKVLEWGEIATALSNVLTGQGESSELTVIFTDQDHTFRQLDEDDLLVGCTCVVKMNTDENRRALIPWRTRYRGQCVAAEPMGVDKYKLTFRDPVADRFSKRTNPFPDYLLRQNEFPNCGIDKVSGSSESYVANGAAAIGATTIGVKNGWGVFCPGQEFTFASHATVYTIGLNPAATWDPESSIVFAPALTNAVADGEALTMIPSFAITPNINKPGRVRYGYHTDRTIVGGDDVGDGQGPLQYAGDIVLGDGKTYGTFLWAIHACATPNPIEMIYAWNDAIDHAHSAYFYPGVTLSVPQPGLTVEAATEVAGLGGRIAIYGHTNWTSVVGATKYVDTGDIRCTPVYLRGFYRDWALGILGPPLNVGGVPIAVAAHGCAVNGDGSGDEIVDGFPAYLHVLQNWCPPRSTAYRKGDWLSTPLFLDGTPVIDEPSFATAQEASAVWVPDGGFMAVFSLGENDEQVSALTFIAAANRSFGSQSGINRQTQFSVRVPVTAIAGATLQTTLDWIRDIFSGSFSLPPRLSELYTAIDYVHTKDYFRRVATGWRSSLGVDLSSISALNTHSSTSTIYNDAATVAFGGTDVDDVRRYSTYEMPFVRGRRGAAADNNPPEYERGDNTIAAVLALLLARISAVQHLPSLQAGPQTFNSDLGDIVPITHYEGLGSGWTEEPVVIERMHVNPTTFTGTIEGYQRAPLEGAL